MASLGGPAITAVSGSSASVGGSNSSSSGGKKPGDQSQGIGGLASSGPSRPSGMISVPLNVATLVGHTVVSPYSGLIACSCAKTKTKTKPRTKDFVRPR